MAGSQRVLANKVELKVREQRETRSGSVDAVGHIKAIPPGTALGNAKDGELAKAGSSGAL